MLKYTLIFILDNPSGTILMLERANKPNAGKYNGVGGKIKPGETPYQGALREVQEEVGVDVGGLSFVGTVTWDGAAETGSAGMYVYLTYWPENLGRAPVAGKETPEGRLDWFPEEWVIDPSNRHVVDNIHRFLPYILAMRDADLPLLEHHCIYDGWTLKRVEQLPVTTEVVKEATS